MRGGRRWDGGWTAGQGYGGREPERKVEVDSLHVEIVEEMMYGEMDDYAKDAEE